MNSETLENTFKKNREDFLNKNGVVEPDVTEKGIYGFFGSYRWLSNFHECPIQIEDRVFGNTEAAYMAEKTDDEVDKARLQHMTGPDAKKYGQTVQLRKDWDTVKFAAMKKVVGAKFSQNEDLKAALLATGDKYLEETNWWKDQYWGVWNGKGQNALGKILMDIRDELRLSAK